jgi:hypothetical protein
LRPAFRFPDVRPRRIFDNAVKPGGKLGAAFELVQILEGQQKSFLHCIFGVLIVS